MALRPMARENLVEMPILPYQVPSDGIAFEALLPQGIYNEFELQGRITFNPNQKVFGSIYEQFKPIKAVARFNFEIKMHYVFQSGQSSTRRMTNKDRPEPPILEFNFKIIKEFGTLKFNVNGYDTTVPVQQTNKPNSRYVIKFTEILGLKDLKIKYSTSSCVNTPSSGEAMEMLLDMSEEYAPRPGTSR